ncbi:MAG: ribonuclease D, partial [Rhizobiales bacterium]|nr:ribonuclease D [Hyphomicrobiales bacterium]
MDVITETEPLRTTCKALRKCAYVAIDTEFMRDKTYWSKLCLVQLAGEGIEAIVDPLADIDLAPLIELLADQNVVKVFHAGRQDIEIFYHMAQMIPAPVFDSQVAAMVCGFGDSVSYDNLVRRLTGAQIDKSSRFTDWARRPLSERQLNYAMADVTHLRVVYERLSKELEKTGRISWLDEELSVPTSESTYDLSPERAWERVKAKPKSKRALAALIEIAAWREVEAQRIDVPRNRVLKDEALVEIANNLPKSEADFAMLRALPRGFERSKGARGLLEAIERGRHRPAESVPKPRQRESLPERLSPIVDLLRVVLRLQSKRHRVAQRLIATAEDLEQIARNDDADVAALSGWRHELFGSLALDVKHG